MVDSSIVERAIVDVECTDSEFDALVSAFQESGFEIEIDRALIRKSMDELPWVMYLTLAPGVLVGAFFKAMAEEAGRDVYEWLKRVAAARKSSHGSVLVQDEEHTNVVLNAGLTPEAAAALATIDWEKASGAYLVWDVESQRWYYPRASDREIR